MIKFVDGKENEYGIVNERKESVMTYFPIIEKDNFDVIKSYKYQYNNENIYMDNIGDGVYRIITKLYYPELKQESGYSSDIVSSKVISELTLLDKTLDRSEKYLILIPTFIKGEKGRFYISLESLMKITNESDYKVGYRGMFSSFCLIKKI